MPDDLLFIDDADRYQRLRLISWWEQDKLRAARVLVVGAGALGNEVLKNLALLGVGGIWVIDLDRVENSNLARSVLFRGSDQGRPKAEVAAARIRELNPDVKVRAFFGNVITDLGLGLFADADVVIGCLDNREARLWVNRCCWKVGTPWIDGGIQEISGVCKVFVPPDSPCYECGMTDNDYKLINLRYSCPLLRREDMLEGKVPTAPTIASMIAGLQTQEALKLLHGMNGSAGKAMIFNGIANSFYTTDYPYKPDCLSHETYGEIVELPLSNSATAAELFDAAEASGRFGGAEFLMEVQLDRDVVVSLDCTRCRTCEPVFRPRALVGMREAKCPRCGELRLPRAIHSAARFRGAPGGNRIAQGEHAGRTLAELGVPLYDVVRVAAGENVAHCLLAADRQRVQAE